MAASRWTLRDAGPAMYERGVAGTARLAIYKNQTAIAATSGTYTLTDAGGTTILSGATSSDGFDTTATILSTDTTTAMSFSTRWRESWAVTVGGEAKTFHRDAWLVRSVLYSTVTVDDLVSRHRNLIDLVDGGREAIEGYKIEAWKTVEGDLIKRGKRPNLIMESWALRSLETFRTLALCFTDASTRFDGDDRYSELAEHYTTLADEEWTKNMRFEYDADEDGLADSKQAATNVLILTAGNMTGPRLRMGGYR